MLALLDFRKVLFYTALYIGVNMPDHDVMFSNMTSLIHQRVTPNVAVLKSKDCPNIKSIMAKTVQQLMENVDVVGFCNLKILLA